MSHPTPLSHRLLRRFRRAGLRSGALLASVLALASLLGVLHAITHPPDHLFTQITQSLSSRTATLAASNDEVAVLGASPLTSEATARSWLGSLFHHQAGDIDCRIFDHLCHGSSAPATALQIPGFSPPIAAALMTLEGEYIARWSALFDARGPPYIA